MLLPMVKIPIYRICHGPAGGSDEDDDQGPVVLFYGLHRQTLTSSLAPVGSTSKTNGFPKIRLVVR